MELVSPGNQDREESRRALAVKCAAYIQRALGLIVVDIVTSRQSRPFPEIMALLAPGHPVPIVPPLTAVSFRPARIDGVDTVEIRHRPLEVGDPLPRLPLALGGFWPDRSRFGTGLRRSPGTKSIVTPRRRPNRTQTAPTGSREATGSRGEGTGSRGEGCSSSTS